MTAQKFEIVAKTDIGKVRDYNEDSHLIKNYEFENERYYLLAVADGVGGHPGGEAASKIAVNEISRSFEKNFAKDKESWQQAQQEKSKYFNIDFEIYVLGLTVGRANKEIYKFAKSSEKIGMSTTLTIALIKELEVWIANVGDSRAYIFKNNKLQQITRDHSYVQKLIDQKIISTDEAFDHSLKHIVTKVAGLRKNIKIDVYPPLYPYYMSINRLKQKIKNVHSIHLSNNDVLLLCTDGLTDMLRDTEIEEILRSSENIEVVSKKLISQANEKGGKDNITVILARVRYVT